MRVMEIHGHLRSKASQKDLDQKERELKYLMSQLATDKGKRKLKRWYEANKAMCGDMKVSGFHDFPGPIPLSLFIEALCKESHPGDSIL